MENQNNKTYTYTLEKQPNNVQKITIQFDKEHLDNLFNEEAKNLKNKVAIKGFRPGKVPERLFKKLFQNDFIKSKTVEMLKDILKEIIKNENLKPLNEELVLYQKEDVDNIIENNYKLQLELPIIPDFSSINFENITIKKKRQKITDEHVEGFIEAEKLKNSKLSPKQDGKSEENNVLEVSFNLYETDQSETQPDNKPTISRDSIHIFLTDIFIKNFSNIELNGYNIEKKDILGLEKGAFKKIIITKTKDNITKKAYIDLWVKNILSIEEDQTMENMLKLWNVVDSNQLKNSVKNFLNEIEEFEAKMHIFKELLNIIMNEHKVDISYPAEIERSIAKTYLEDFVYTANIHGIPTHIIEKQLQKFSTTDKNYLLYKLEMLLTNYFLETNIQPTSEDILKMYSLISKIPPYPALKEKLLKSSNILKFIMQKFSLFKTIEKILAKIKIEEEDTTLKDSPI